tara:strand:+ start:105 stop:227 length:123 start_codon:yes stop_codon:yes gene_type:complete
MSKKIPSFELFGGSHLAFFEGNGIHSQGGLAMYNFVMQSL